MSFNIYLISTNGDGEKTALLIGEGTSINECLNILYRREPNVRAANLFDASDNLNKISKSKVTNELNIAYLSKHNPPSTNSAVSTVEPIISIQVDPETPFYLITNIIDNDHTPTTYEDFVVQYKKWSPALIDLLQHLGNAFLEAMSNVINTLSQCLSWLFSREKTVLEQNTKTMQIISVDPAIPEVKQFDEQTTMESTTTDDESSLLFPMTVESIDPSPSDSSSSNQNGSTTSPSESENEGDNAEPVIPSKNVLTNPDAYQQEDHALEAYFKQETDRRREESAVEISLTQTKIKGPILENFVRVGLPRTQSAENKSTVLVLGNTGAGKSTTINYMMGCEMEKKKQGSIEKAVPKDQTKEFAKIGHGFESQTLYPQVYQGGEIAYCDCAGFRDTRSKEEKICSSRSLELAIKSAEEISGIMLVIDFNSLLTDGGASFREKAQHFSRLFKNFNSITANSILFVFTHIPPSPESKDEIIACIDDYLKIETKKNKNADFVHLLTLMKNNPDNIIVPDVFNEGNGDSRNQIQEKLKTLSPVAKEAFNFSAHDSKHVKLDNSLYDLVQTGISLMHNKIYSEQMLQTIKANLKQIEESHLFYNQVTKFLNKENIFLKQNLIKKSNFKKTKNLALLSELTQEMDRLSQEINTDQALLGQLDTHESILYWQAHVADLDERTIFNYDNVPFSQVETETNKNGEFKERIYQPEDGKYTTAYDRSEGKQEDEREDTKLINANLKVFIEKRHKPDNAFQIQNLKHRLQQNQENRTALLKRCEMIKQENEILEQLISPPNANESRPDIQPLLQSLSSEIERLIKDQDQLTQNLTENEAKWMEKADLFKTAADHLSSVDPDSALIKHFIVLYQYCSSNLFQKSFIHQETDSDDIILSEDENSSHSSDLESDEEEGSNIKVENNHSFQETGTIDLPAEQEWLENIQKLQKALEENSLNKNLVLPSVFSKEPPLTEEVSEEGLSKELQNEMNIQH